MRPHVVAVDDSPICLKSIVRALESELNARVAAFSCPAEAFAFVDSQVVDLLVCDMLMPLVNGEDLIRAVRTRPGLRRLPIVAVTLHENHTWLAENTPALVDIMFKPIEPVALACRARLLMATSQEIRRLERYCHHLERKLFDTRCSATGATSD